MPLTQAEWDVYITKVKAILKAHHPNTPEKDIDALVRRALNFGDRLSQEASSVDEMRKAAGKYGDRLRKKWLK